MRVTYDSLYVSHQILEVDESELGFKMREFTQVTPGMANRNPLALERLTRS